MTGNLWLDIYLITITVKTGLILMIESRRARYSKIWGAAFWTIWAFQCIYLSQR